MAWLPISGTVPQYEASGVAAVGHYLKFYKSGTTTPTNMATDSTGGTTLAKSALDANGFPLNGSSAIFIPHIDQHYKLALFANATDADNNTLGSAVWVIDAMTVSPDRSFATVAAMVAATDLKVGDFITVEEYLSGKGGGVLFFKVVAAATGTADGGQYIDLATHQALQNFPSVISVKAFGAAGDGTGAGAGTDDYTAIDKCWDYVIAAGGGTIEYPFGTYVQDTTLNKTFTVPIKVEGHKSTIDHTNTGSNAMQFAGSMSSAGTITTDLAALDFTFNTTDTTLVEGDQFLLRSDNFDAPAADISFDALTKNTLVTVTATASVFASGDIGKSIRQPGAVSSVVVFITEFTSGTEVKGYTNGFALPGTLTSTNWEFGTLATWVRAEYERGEYGYVDTVHGTVTLDSGASGSVDGITVNSVEIMSGAESFDSSLATTATNVAANITANTSSPNYRATASGAVISIFPASGSTPTGFTVVSSSTTIATTDVNMIIVTATAPFLDQYVAAETSLYKVSGCKLTINDLTIEGDSNHRGLKIDKAINTRLTNCHISGSRAACYEFQECFGLSITDCTNLDSWVTPGIGTNYGLSIVASQNVKVSGGSYVGRHGITTGGNHRSYHLRFSDLDCSSNTNSSWGFDTHANIEFTTVKGCNLYGGSDMTSFNWEFIDCYFNLGKTALVNACKVFLPPGHGSYMKFTHCKFDVSATTTTSGCIEVLPEYKDSILDLLQIDDCNVVNPSASGVIVSAPNTYDSGSIIEKLAIIGNTRVEVKHTGIHVQAATTPTRACLVKNIDIDARVENTSDDGLLLFLEAGTGFVSETLHINHSKFFSAAETSTPFSVSNVDKVTIANTEFDGNDLATLCQFPAVNDLIIHHCTFKGFTTTGGLNAVGAKSILVHNNDHRESGGIPALTDTVNGRPPGVIFGNLNRQANGTAVPSAGTWISGDVSWNTTPTLGGQAGWVCTASGTFEDATDSTGTTDHDGTSLQNRTITGMTDTSDYAVGEYVTVDQGFPSATAPYRIDAITSTTMTLDTQATSTQSGVTVATVDPVFATFGDITLSGSTTWDAGSIADGDEEAKEITVTGAALGDYCMVSFSLDVADLVLTADVTASNTVTAILANNTGGAIDLGSGTIKARVIK